MAAFHQAPARRPRLLPWVPPRGKASLVGMRLTVVGCSGSVPSAHSAASCYLLEAEGFRLVVDLGSGGLGALQRYVTTSQIDAVALSHLHADHFIDMCSLWVARKYRSEGTLRPLTVYGP